MNICILGIKGKMGSKLYLLLKDKYNVFGIDLVKDQQNIYDDYKECVSDNNIDVLIDFSSNECSYEVCKYFLDNKIKVISGTTNLDKKQIKELVKTAKKNKTSYISCFNYSPGINLVYSLVKRIKKNYKSITIREKHQTSKKDSPSGTAKVLADIIKIEYNSIDCKRIENQNAYHEITFENEYERITLSHEVLKYEVFIQGFLEYFNEIITRDLIIKVVK